MALSKPTIYSVHKDSMCGNEYEIKMTDSMTNEMRVILAEEECELSFSSSLEGKCLISSEDFKKEVRVEILDDNSTIFAEVLQVTHNWPLIKSVLHDEDFSGEVALLKLDFQKSISCFTSENFSFIMTSKNENSEKTELIIQNFNFLKNTLFVQLPSNDSQSEDFTLETYFTSVDGEKIMLDSRLLALSSQSSAYEKKENKISGSPLAKRMRNLATTTLRQVTPSTIYANTNPISLQLTFDAFYVVGDVKTVSLSGPQSVAMTIGAVNAGLLTVMFTNTATINTGTYTFSITDKNDATVITSTITLTVVPSFIVSFYNRNNICPGTDFTAAGAVFFLTFNQPIANTVSSITVVKLVKGIDTYTLDIGTVQNIVQLNVNRAIGIPSTGAYEIQVIDSLGTTFKCPKLLSIGYPYKLTKLNNYYFGTQNGAHCATLTANYVFDSNIAVADFTFFKMGIQDNQTSTINSSNSKQIDAVFATPNAGSYAPTVVDKCGITITNDDAKSIVIDKLPDLSSFTPICSPENTGFTTTLTFASNLDSNFYTGTKFINTSNAETTLTSNTITLATIPISTTTGLAIGTYTIVSMGLCSKISSPATTFAVTIAPTISSTAPLVFDTNKVTTTITLNKAIAEADLTEVKLYNGVDTYVKTTVTFPTSTTIKVVQADVAAGTYKIKLTFGCSYYQETGSITVVAVPVMSSDNPKCYKQDNAISFTSTFAAAVATNLMASSTIMTTDETPANAGSLTVSDPNGAVLTLTLTAGLANTGKYTYYITDNSDTKFAGITKIQITEKFAPTTPTTVWDINSTFTLTLTFDKAFSTLQITAVKLEDTANAGNVITISSVNENLVAKTIVAVFTGGVPTAGLYNIYAVDWCTLTHVVTTQLRITTIPTISSMTPKCFLISSAISLTATFSQTIYTGQFKSTGAILGGSGGTVALTVGAQTSPTIALTGSAPSTMNDYSLTVVDMASTSITSTQLIRIVTTMTPTLSVSPTIYDNNYNFVLTISTVQTLATNQMSTATLILTNGSITTMTISSQGTNQVVLTSSKLTTSGVYSLALTDTCGQTYSLAECLRIVDIPNITKISTKCFNQNQAISEVVTFDRQVYNNQFIYFKMFDNADVLSGTGTIAAVGTDNTVTVTNTGIASLGLYYITFTDMAFVSIPYTSTKIRILPATLAVVSYTPMTWDSGLQMTVVITFNQTVQTGQIVLAKFVSTGGTYPINYVSNSGSTWTGTVTLPKAASTSSVYTLTITDFCDATFNASNTLQVVDLPTFTSLAPYCFVKNVGSNTVNLTFNYLATITQSGVRQISSAQLTLTGQSNQALVQLAASTTNVQGFTVPSIPSPANYGLSLTDLAGQVIPNSAVIKIRNYDGPATLTAYEYLIWRTDIAVNWKLSFNRNIDSDEMITLNFKNTGTNALTAGTLGAISLATAIPVVPAKISVVFPVISTAGNYVAVLTDTCGNTITGGSTLVLTVPPVISNYSVTNFKMNTITTFNINLNIDYPVGYFTAVSCYNTYTKSTITLTLGTKTSAVQPITTPNTLPMGVYTFTLTDVTGTLTTHANKIFVLEQVTTPVVQSFTPNFFPPAQPISFNITFNFNLIIEQFTYARMTCADNVVRTLTMTGVSGRILTVTFTSGIIAVGNCAVSVMHFTNVLITTTVPLTIVTPITASAVTAISTTCAVVNTPLNLLMYLNRNLDSNLFIVTSILKEVNTSATLPITLNLPAQISPLTGVFINGISAVGTYKVSLTDSLNYNIVSQSLLRVLSTPPQIFRVTPLTGVTYDGITINFSLIFDISLLGTDVSTAYLKDSSGNLTPMLITGVVGTEVKISSVNFVPLLSTSYTPIIQLCNTQVMGPAFQITMAIPVPVPTPTPSPTPNPTPTPTPDPTPIPSCPQYAVFNPTTQSCNTCDTIFQFFYSGACLTSCPAGFSVYNGSICVETCQTYALVSYQNICQAQCPSGTGVNSTSTCINCPSAGQYLFGSTCLAICPSGYSPNSVGTCAPVINMFDSTTKSTCGPTTCNGGTCSILSNTQVSCACPTGKTGVLCETLVQDVTPDKISNLVSSVTSQTPTSNTYYQVMSLQNLLTANKTLTTQSTSDTIYNYTVANLQRLSSSKNTKDSDANVLKLVDLSIALQLNLNSASKMRVLQTTTSAAQIKNLMTLTSSFVQNFVANKASFPTAASIFMGSTYVNAQFSVNVNAALADFTTLSTNNKLVLLDMGNCLTQLASSSPNMVVTKVDYSQTLNSYFGIAASSSSLVNVFVWDATNKKSVSTSACIGNNAIALKYPLATSQKPMVNLPKYLTYKAMGVESFSSSDPVFNSRCSMLGNFLTYDTTQNYRRFQIFQNATITCQGTNCAYNQIDANGYVNCMCSTVDNTGAYNSFQSFVFTPTTDINLELATCPYIAFTTTQVYRNAGFWVGLIALLGLILVISIGCCVNAMSVKDTKAMCSAIETDRLAGKMDYESVTHVPTELKSEREDDKPVEEKDVNIEMEKLDAQTPNTKRKKKKKVVKDAEPVDEETDFASIFSRSLNAVHPVVRLFSTSLVLPFSVKLSLFIFNCFMYFSFNAFVFTDSYIELRVNDVDRDSFGYPMKAEFAKIMAAIVITMGFNIIFKIIALPSSSAFYKLKGSISNKKSTKTLTATCADYQKDMTCKYIFTFVLVTMFSLFFFYYDFVFCAVYVNSSASWVYSGLWSLIMVWFGFAPFVALMMSILESSCSMNSSAYSVWLFSRILF